MTFGGHDSHWERMKHNVEEEEIPLELEKNQFPEDLRAHAESGHDGWVVRLGMFMDLSY